MKMDFESALQYLEQFVSYEKLVKVPYNESNFDLVNFRKFLDKSGIDYSKLKIFHVGGSKGKGSVSTMIAQYLRKKGLKSGLFTSPHIFSVRERFWFDGELISEKEFAKYVQEIKRFLSKEKFNLTYFEILTAIAFKFFLDRGAEYAVLEVGLGGRLDSTNVVRPLVSVLTLIEKEHVDILGPTLKDIVREKLGIKKRGVPLVVGFQKSAVRELIQDQCREAIFVDVKAQTADMMNANLAILALKKGLKTIDMALFAEVLSEFKMPGRFDIRQIAGKTVVFDMAHTVSSVKNLILSLERTFPEKEFVFLVSVMKGKQVKQIFKEIANVASKVVLTSSNKARGYSGKEIFDLTEGILRCEISENPELAYKKLKKELKKNQVLVITGSHFLVSRLLKP